MSEEYRSTQRFRAYLPVRVHRAHTPHVIETLTKDIGMSGLRCISSMVCPVSSEVSLELVLGSHSEALELRGRTVWFQTIPHSEQFDLGIVFLDLSPQNKRRLSVYLERLSVQQAVPA